MTTKNSKTTLNEIVNDFKTDGAISSKDFMPEVADLVAYTPRTIIEYSPIVTPADIASRIGFGHRKADNSQAAMLMVNKDAKFASNRDLSIIEFPIGGELVKLNIARGMFNLIADLLDHRYHHIENGASWKVDPGCVNYMTNQKEAVYTDGRYLKGNGFVGEFDPAGFYVGNITFGAYSFRKLQPCKYDKERVAKLSTTVEGIKLVAQEDTDRNMLAKFLAGQVLASGLRYHVWPVFFKKEDEDKWAKDMEHIQKYLSGFEASFAGNQEAKAIGKMLYQRAVVKNQVRVEEAVVTTMGQVLDLQELTVKVQRGATVVVEPASAIVGTECEISIPGAAKMRKVITNANVGFYSRHDAILVPVS